MLPRILAIVLPLLLVVPNIALCHTEEMGFAAGATNILLPLGVYYLLMSSWRRVGVTSLLLLPFMILAAFQIVLLYLYGGSIIAVDMFINVVTTNATEVSELLGNLIYAILFILVLYLPPIVISIVFVAKHREIGVAFRRKLMWVGAALGVLGGASCAWAYGLRTGYSVSNDLFPVNVCCNIATAVHRTAETIHYPESSADFRYDASHHPSDSTAREIYVLVVGETSRADRWQLLGAERPTNPRLSKRTDVVAFPKALTQSNTTHKSVPMMMSVATAESFDTISRIKSVLSAFGEAGFSTAFLSNQRPNRSFTEHFSRQADRTVYTSESLTGNHPYDAELLGLLAEEIADTAQQRLFIVLHTYGSHFTYRDRYPKEFSRFLPDEVVDANRSNRSTLLNAYDNSIVYTDFLLDSIIGMLEQSGAKAAMLYASDHGEDIFDDSRNRFLHASPTPTAYQLHVPAIAWLSDDPAHAPLRDALVANSQKMMSPSVQLFHTILQIAEISTPYFIPSASLVSPEFQSPTPLYLTDHNCAVPLCSSGLKPVDFSILKDIMAN